MSIRFTPRTVLKILGYIAGVVLEFLFLVLPNETAAFVEATLGLTGTTIVEWVLKGLAVVLGVGLVLAAILAIRQHFSLTIGRKVELIGGVMSYVFFPEAAQHESLQYHEKHLGHRLIVNYKVHPPKAYIMTRQSYGWKMTKAYPNHWAREIDPSPSDDSFLERWCKERKYVLVRGDATKEQLLEAEPEAVQELAKRPFVSFQIGGPGATVTRSSITDSISVGADEAAKITGERVEDSEIRGVKHIKPKKDGET